METVTRYGNHQRVDVGAVDNCAPPFLIVPKRMESLRVSGFSYVPASRQNHFTVILSTLNPVEEYHAYRFQYGAGFAYAQDRKDGRIVET